MNLQRHRWVTLASALLGSLARRVRLLRRLVDRFAPRPAEPQTRLWERRIEHADERSMRRIAEAQHGGVSSQESAARYERGDNPGGTHRKAVPHNGPAHQRPERDEPQERKQRVPRGERHMSVSRKGS